MSLPRATRTTSAEHQFDLDMDTRLHLDQALAAVAGRAIPAQRGPATGDVTTTL